MSVPSPKYSLALLLLLASVPLQALHALAHDEPQKRTISLVATGAVKTTPDKVDISTGVTSEAKSAREALDQNTEAMAKVVEALKADGIEPKDIQTTNFSSMPRRPTSDSARFSASARRKAPISPASRRPPRAWRCRRTFPSRPAPPPSRCASG
jgi:uncharacterized protein YggE